ncbi:MAG: HEAT repeat domain-containing protein [Pyrinomonadaceae bacterium]
MHDGNGNHRPTNSNGATRAGEAAAAAPDEKRRTPWALVVVAVLFVVVPFLTWYGTSFWRTLSDAQVDEYLSDTSQQRRVQHALEEIDRRIVKGDEGARRWYPRVVQISNDPATDLRMAAAWVMGDDNTSEDFHAALRRLLDDDEPAVRRMAALSLTRFDDARSRAELVSMLGDYSVKAGVSGKVLTILPVGSAVSRQAMIARLRDDAGQTRELRAPVSGGVEKVSVAEGASVSPTDELVVLSPDADNALQALRALFVVGTTDDLPEIERYAGGVAGMPPDVQKQAALTSEEIKRRASQSR